MGIPPVNQRGSTLVELMIASLLGLIVLGMLSSLMISTQSLTMQRSLRLLLTQNLHGVIEQIKRDGDDGELDEYQLDNRSLKLCEESNQNCYALFDPKQIVVETFQIKTESLTDDHKSSAENSVDHVSFLLGDQQRITVELSAYITQQPEIRQTMRATFRLRHLIWIE